MTKYDFFTQTLNQKSLQEFILYHQSKILNLPESALKFLKLNHQKKGILETKDFNFCFGEDYSDNYVKKIKSLTIDTIIKYWQIKTLQGHQISSLLEGWQNAIGQEEWLPKLIKEKQKIIYLEDNNAVIEQFNLFKFITLKHDVPQRNPQNHIEETLFHLDLFYWIERLNLDIIQLSHQKLFEIDYQELNIALIPNFNKFKASSHLFNVLYLAQCLVKSAQEKDFDILETFWSTHKHLWDNEINKTVLLILINFGIHQINRKNRAYNQITLNLYKKALELDVLLEHNKITPFAFKNITTIGLILKEFDWVKHFIETNKNNLPQTLKSDYYHFALAKYYFEIKDFKSAKKLFNTLEIEDEILQLNTKTILLKIHYEERDFEALEYLLDSFKSYIKRKKVQGFYKNYFLTLVKFTTKLIKCYQTIQYVKLKKEVDNAKQMASKDWLLEKIEEELQ